MRYQEGYVWFLLFSSVDIILTWHILRKGGLEVNPLARVVIEHWDLAGAIAFKFSLVLFVVVACEIVGRHEDRLGKRLTAVAIAASSRLNPLLTLAVCAGFFVLGLVADSALGRFADGSSIANVVYHAVFNLQVFWIADGLSDGRSIPAGYVVRAGAYAVTYQAAVLFFAMFLFQNREIAR